MRVEVVFAIVVVRYGRRNAQYDVCLADIYRRLRQHANRSGRCRAGLAGSAGSHSGFCSAQATALAALHQSAVRESGRFQFGGRIAAPLHFRKPSRRLGELHRVRGGEVAFQRVLTNAFQIFAAGDGMPAGLRGCSDSLRDSARNP